MVASTTGTAHAGPGHGRLVLEKEEFGSTADGQAVQRYTFGDPHGLLVRMLTWGAVIQSIEVPDRHGRRGDVILGFETLDEYLAQSPFFGATIGRYANRIAGGSFSIDGTQYQIPLNDGQNALHGGPVGFDKKVWTAEEVRADGRVGVRFGYVSPDGEMGFPGTLTTSVTYTVDSRGQLSIHFQATTDKPTIINLTNHSYFNLGGEGQDTVYDHVVTINADRYTPIDATSIPLGPLPPVQGTPFDFRRPHTFGERIRTGDEQILNAKGYDHNWVLNGQGLRLAARVIEPRTGRGIECRTTEPGVQVYTGNFLNGAFAGIGGNTYRQGDAFTLETQHFPDSPNQPSYPSTILRPGQEFDSRTVFRFFTD